MEVENEPYSAESFSEDAETGFGSKPFQFLSCARLTKVYTIDTAIFEVPTACTIFHRSFFSRPDVTALRLQNFKGHPRGKMKPSVILLLLLLFQLVIPISTVQAYFDPGTGSMLFQALVAVLATVGVFYRRILDFFRKILHLDKTEETDIFSKNDRPPE